MNLHRSILHRAYVSSMHTYTKLLVIRLTTLHEEYQQADGKKRLASVHMTPKVTYGQSIFQIEEQLNISASCILLFTVFGFLACFVDKCQLLKPRIATMHASREFQIDSLSNASWTIYTWSHGQVSLYRFSHKPGTPKHRQFTSTQVHGNKHTHTHTHTQQRQSWDLQICLDTLVCVEWLHFLTRFFPLCKFGQAWNPARRLPILQRKAKQQHHPTPDVGSITIAACYTSTAKIVDDWSSKSISNTQVNMNSGTTKLTSTHTA